MAAADESPLKNLEDELTCCICLSPFQSPVTIPCGHNFCQDCLLATWTEFPFCCPQCRTFFATRPELKKNTVLSAVVETFKLSAGKGATGGGASPPAEERKSEQKRVVRCDTCMEAEASKTCLTCMVSFCEEHLRPHRDNPMYFVHQLSEPMGDLAERICPDHHKLMELFCLQHQRLICSFCLQQVHKGCSFSTPEDQRRLKESDLRGKLELLDGKILKNETVISQMKDMQTRLTDSGTNRKKALAAEYLQIRDMLVKEEQEACHAVDHEVENSRGKIKGLMKKFSENIDNMTKAKEEIRNLLQQSQTNTFLKTTYNLPQAASFDPYTPRITSDSKKSTAAEIFPALLRKHLTEMLAQPVAVRVQRFVPGGAQFVPHPTPNYSREPERTSPKPTDPVKPVVKKKNPPKTAKPSAGLSKKSFTKSTGDLVEFGTKPGLSSEIPLDIAPSEKRTHLLKFGTVLTFDPRTAHKRIVLSEGFTKAATSEEHTNYPECPERFAVCSQVLATKGFTRGRHYWEVRLSSNNFIGIGLAYASIDRKGPTSRLGRNNKSWCMEWFNVKLSAWHDGAETVLANPNPKRVGVLLDCEGGTATFYNVADRAYPLHSFSFPLAEAVYPAFWIFSSGSFISLCKLQ